MNPIKNFVYHTLQLLCLFPLLYAVIRYRDVHDYDNFAFKLGDWFTEKFLEE